MHKNVFFSYYCNHSTLKYAKTYIIINLLFYASTSVCMCVTSQAKLMVELVMQTFQAQCTTKLSAVFVASLYLKC